MGLTDQQLVETRQESGSRLRRIALCIGFGLFPALLGLTLLSEAIRPNLDLTVLRDYGFADYWELSFAVSFLLMPIALLAVIARRSLTAAGLVGVLMLAIFVYVPSTFRGCSGGSQESSAVAQLKTINTAEVTFMSTNNGRYGTIKDMVSQGLLDDRFENGSISGYNFTVTVSDKDYTATAMPRSNEAGKFGYYSTPDAVIRYAKVASPTCEPCFPADLAGQPVG
jgi:hypothetical protein